MDETENKPVLYGKQESSPTSATNKQLEPVVSTPGVKKKKTKGQLFKEEFISEDAGKVKSYLWESVIKPSIKDTIWNLITKGLKMFLYSKGDSPDLRTGIPGEVPRINYTDYWNRRNSIPAYPVGRTAYNYGEVILANRGEAEEVVRRMYDLIRQSGVATIGDLYQLCNMPTQFTDFTYGWRDLADARIISVEGGYLISLPRPYPI